MARGAEGGGRGEPREKETYGQSVNAGYAVAVAPGVPGPVRIRGEQRTRARRGPARDGAQPGRHSGVADVRQENSAI